MKLTVVTYGTEGDTRPLAALCRVLMETGHETHLLADRATLGSAVALGVPASALSGDIRAALMPGATLGSVVSGKARFNATAKALASIANASTHAWMQETADASAGCDAIIVSGLAAFVGLSVAEYRRVPVLGAGLIPLTPTGRFASPFLPPGKVPRWLNPVSHRLVNGLLWRAFRRATNAARARVCGLEPRGGVWTDHPMLYGVSPSLLPRPRDWPANATVCGQWRAPSGDWTPPAHLARFLAAGEPPLYIGFGSMAGFDRTGLVTALTEAADGRRVLFYPGWSGVNTALLPKNFCVIGETPHDWLFARVSAVVHHSGSGTTHSACRAGVPSVAVPFAGDQFFWAHRLAALGVAPPAVDGRRLRAAALKQAIAYAERGDVKARAAALGSRMAGEDGLATAVSEVERLIAR
ncbi:glycosyltransferase [Paraburkholderia pallida]|uniref:Glycosyltransferase n=1 Tax=Paraburkholderia pallida TaxID=2547399 RepID=A0A4P7CSW3_9BURK|nr:glycosyltransferase [Paraburkholderia pallida]QBQ97304.1 glycosyltransferase [Paraburkholderia pallida]